MKHMVLEFCEKRFYFVKDKMICHNMKKRNLELIKYILENLDDKRFEINVLKDIAKKVLIGTKKMLEYS